MLSAICWVAMPGTRCHLERMGGAALFGSLTPMPCAATALALLMPMHVLLTRTTILRIVHATTPPGTRCIQFVDARTKRPLRQHHPLPPQRVILAPPPATIVLRPSSAVRISAAPSRLCFLHHHTHTVRAPMLKPIAPQQPVARFSKSQRDAGRRT
jgi:hypothetical protein